MLIFAAVNRIECWYLEATLRSEKDGGEMCTGGHAHVTLRLDKERSKYGDAGVKHKLGSLSAKRFSWKQRYKRFKVDNCIDPVGCAYETVSLARTGGNMDDNCGSAFAVATWGCIPSSSSA